MNRNCPRKTPFKIRKVPSIPKKRKLFEIIIHAMFQPSDRVFKIERKEKSEEITCSTCNGTEYLPKTHWKFKYRPVASKVAEVAKCPDCYKGKQRKITHQWELTPNKWVVSAILPTIKNDGVKIAYELKDITCGCGSGIHPIDEEFLFLHEDDAKKSVEDKNNSPENKWDDKIQAW